MPVTTYTVMDGELLSENRNGVKRDYVNDPSGNVIALLDSSQNITDTFTYWPYGELKSRTGTTPTPFQYGGAAGYYRDKINSIYIRRRHLRPDLGRWQTQNPIGFRGGDFNLYRYVRNAPTVWQDFSGLDIVKPPDTKQPLPKCLTLCKGLQGEAWAVCMLQCLRKNGKKQYKYCAYVYCLAFPESEFCHYGLDPCDTKGRLWTGKECDCCEITFECCIRSIDDPKMGPAACQKAHTDCALKWNCGSEGPTCVL